jgi:hypothetical protein
VDSSPAIGEWSRVIKRLFAALLFGEGAEATTSDKGFDEAVEDVGDGEEGDTWEGRQLRHDFHVVFGLECCEMREQK